MMGAWPSWSQFLHMGGYAGYVWGSLGMTAALVLLEIWQLRLRRRSLQAILPEETP